MKKIQLSKREELVQNVKDCGQALIDNAESIVGNEEFMTSLDVWCTIAGNDFPEISIDRKFIPDNIINRNRGE